MIYTASTPEIRETIERLCSNTNIKAQNVVNILGDETYDSYPGENSFDVAEWFIARFRYEMRWNEKMHQSRLINEEDI